MCHLVIIYYAENKLISVVLISLSLSLSMTRLSDKMSELHVSVLSLLQYGFWRLIFTLRLTISVKLFYVLAPKAVVHNEQCSY